MIFTIARPHCQNDFMEKLYNIVAQTPTTNILWLGYEYELEVALIHGLQVWKMSGGCVEVDS